VFIKFNSLAIFATDFTDKCENLTQYIYYFDFNSQKSVEKKNSKQVVLFFTHFVNFCELLMKCSFLWPTQWQCILHITQET